MRKLKLLFATLALFLGVGTMHGEDITPVVIKPTSGITDRLTSIAALSGKTFAIINETDGKALYGTNNQNLGYDTYGSAFSASNSGYLWKLVSLANDADTEVQGYYRFQLVTPAGADYNCWGMGGWLNSQPANQACSFILGLNNQNGQDIKNGAVYDVQYVEGQGFTIKNIGTGLYQGANNGPAKNEAPTYFTFATIGTTYVPAVTALLAEGEAWKKIITDETAKETYDATVAAIDPEAIEGNGLTEANIVDAAITELVKAQPAVENANFTRAIINPNFEIGTIEGWTSNGGGGTANNGNFGAATGSFFVERWTAAPGKLSNGSFLQTITGLPAGKFTLTAQMQNREQGNSDAAGTGFFLVANGAKTEAVTNNGATISVTGDVALDDKLEIGTKLENCSGNWICFDNFQLTYNPFTKEEAKTYYDAALAALPDEQEIPTGVYATYIAPNLLDDGTPAEYIAAAKALNEAIAVVTPYVAPYVKFSALKTSANAIAAVEYTETTSGSHTTFTNAITAQTNAANSASSADDITTATTNLVAAIKTYIAGAEPKNDGEYFDITCLMTNPNFDDSHNGWTYLSAPGVNWSNCEYYQNEFDINQTVTGLPTGSYSLSVQAYQRPGWAGNVYNDYINGTDNASSVLYINSITSNVKNIAADAQATYKLGDGSSFDWPNDSRVGTEGSYKYVPNSQQGANLWFAAGLYDATCAAVVDDAANGSLKLGFKSTKTHVSGDWTIFDNFRLYYYGSSLLVYYKQYLPQLKSEASADLSNALYDNVQGLERSKFTSALSATPASETEAAYKTVIDNITEKQAAFRTAVTAYDALVAAKAASLTKISSNIGTGVFQFNEATNNSLYSSYETAKGNVDSYSVDGESTAADIQAIVDAYNTAVNNYNNQALNAPATGKRYNVSIVEDGKDWHGNAITFIAGALSDMGLYGIKYLASANANLNQALKFTAVEGEANTYKVSAINAETGDEQYITTGSTYEGGNNIQIRTTDDANKASWVKIAATTTDGQFQLLNVSDGNKVIANNNNNDMYTAGNANFTIAEAAQASVDIKISAEVKFATRIFPFAPTLPEGMVAYSCEAKGEGDVLTLEEVAEPAANTPYILYAPKGYSGDALTGWGTAGEVQYTAGWLTGVYAATAAPVGSYVLQKNNSDVAFYKVAEGKRPTVGANRGYLTASAAEGARALYFDFGGETTGISTMQNALSTMHNELFDLQGRKVAQPAKGLYIQNGKKIIMK